MADLPLSQDELGLIIKEFESQKAGEVMLTVKGKIFWEGVTLHVMLVYSSVMVQTLEVQLMGS